ncbi:MAG: glycosyltransferase family 9 protein [Gammaproteobacteria bacterium]|nr:glycosyltransferase family 9 protein [Gammaproteobacteria bacterium]
MPASPLQPIVIWLGRVGDMILLSALVGILHRRYGAPCHVIGAGAWPAEIYAVHGDVARVSCLHRYTAFLLDPAWWRTLRLLRATRSDPVYVCEYDPRKLARVRRLLRFAGVDPRRCLFITDDAAPPAHRVDTPADVDAALPHTFKPSAAHWVDRLVRFGGLTPPAFDAGAYPCPPSTAPCAAPRLEVSAAAGTECDAWIASRGLSGQPLVLVQPGNRRTMRGARLDLARDDDKAWPLERWGQLLRGIHAQLPQAAIVLCGAPRESLLLGWIAAAAQLACVVPAELPLSRLLALCARAHSMISVDTGPAHAAAALSLPLVVLFGAHSQAEWLPRSPTGSPVVGIGGPPHSSRLDAIAVETVLAAWRGLPAAPAAAGDSQRGGDLTARATHATSR